MHSLRKKISLIFAATECEQEIEFPKNSFLSEVVLDLVHFR